MRQLLDSRKARSTIPPHTTTQVLLDRKTLTTAYPELTFSGGRGSHVVLTYAEALYDAQLKKGNRNDIAGRHAIGFHDDGAGPTAASNVLRAAVVAHLALYADRYRNRRRAVDAGPSERAREHISV